MPPHVNRKLRGSETSRNADAKPPNAVSARAFTADSCRGFAPTKLRPRHRECCTGFVICPHRQPVFRLGAMPGSPRPRRLHGRPQGVRFFSIDDVVTIPLPHRHAAPTPPRVHGDKTLVDILGHAFARAPQRIPVSAAAGSLKEYLVSRRHEAVDEFCRADRPVYLLEGTKGGIPLLLNENGRVVGVPAAKYPPRRD